MTDNEQTARRGRPKIPSKAINVRIERSLYDKLIAEDDRRRAEGGLAVPGISRIVHEALIAFFAKEKTP